MPPAKKAKPKLPTEVAAITHAEKRANLPTAEGDDFLTPELAQPIPLRYPRDPTLDPQLVWKGKDELDGEDLVAEAPVIYVQEKIDPRVLVENLRDTAARPEDEPELTLFDSFDGLDELDLVEYYTHEANWTNRMILGDSLNVMASLAEREALRGKVQMVYVDPPYGIKFGSNWQVSARKRDVKDGRAQDIVREVEQIRAFRDTWELGINSYLAYLRDRLTVARDLLTQSGSVFVQIGDENMHLVRSLMDEVFGSENFVNSITVQKTHTAGSPSGGTDVLAAVADFILWYCADKTAMKYRQLYEPRPGYDWVNYDFVLAPDGSTRRLATDEKLGLTPLEPGHEVYRRSPLTSSSSPESARFSVEFGGKTYSPGRGGWKTNAAGMAKLARANRLEAYGSTLAFRRFTSDFPYFPRHNIWTDTARGGYGEEQWYVVQTGTKVIERCMLMCTDPGDLVLDPTCGSGTTAVVAEQWGRRWITVDTSRVALALARQRVMGSRFPYYVLSDSVEGQRLESELTGNRASKTEPRGDVRRGFVFERATHVMLKSITGNPDIVDDMGGEAIDAVIARHADFELLYDRPHEDKKKVRVCGPFTVESLAPHRSLAFAGSAVDQTGAVNEGVAGEPSSGDASFEQTILANLRAAGIQNGRKGERLEFSTVEPYAGLHIQAVGEREDAAEGTPSRVGISIGPQYGTVGGAFIRDAAREAIKAGDIDLLCVMAMSFDPSVRADDDDSYVTAEGGFAAVAAERRLGKVPVLLVRMNADLVMGEALKKTGAGNLFTVFGEPDIEIAEESGQLRAVLHGVDVYDPNTGETRSDETDQIALWMIDTAYNGEAFFVRHCYFTGGQDPYKRLKQALKADIDRDAWETLYATESRAFTRPDTGKIAVKVINDYGDEVMKVFDV